MKSLHQAAIIGAGRIGKLHAENIQRYIQNVTIKTVVEISINDELQQWAKNLDIPHLETDYTKALSDPEIDLIFICSATPTHTPIIKAASAQGKHIFCEKPIDLSIPQALSCRESVEKSGIIFQTGFNRRFDHNFQTLRQRIQAGEIGDVRMIRITSRDPALPPEAYIEHSGGIFYDMSIHDFDMLRFLSGSEAAEVYARGETFIDNITSKYNDCDSALISIKLTNNVLAVIENTRETAYGYDQRAEIFGSKGMLTCTNDYPSTVTHFGKQGLTAEKPFHFFLERYSQSYIDEVLTFIECVDTQTPPPVTLTDGIEPLFISEAAKRSWQTQTNIKLVDVKKDFISS